MEIFKQFDITPNNIEIYNQAFCHSSYANEHNIPSDYERLEFLGDTVLDLVVSEYLYNNTDISEGSMTKIRSNYVCENALYEYAKALNFSEYKK
jgi:ribonuclease-3